MKNKEKRQERKTIMVIDDSESIRLLITSYFREKYNIINMGDGQQALQYITEVSIPDLILLDMEMPQMNGRVFLRRLRAAPKFQTVPVIFISCVNSRMIINSMIRLGIIDYIVKPFAAGDLMEKVNNVLDGVSPTIPTRLTLRRIDSI